MGGPRRGAVLTFRSVLAVATTLVIGLMVVSAPAGANSRAPKVASASASYSDGDVVGDWRVVFAGYGEVLFGGTGPAASVTLNPATATSPGETHAALVVSRDSKPASARYSARVTTVQQLRANSAPNAWETGWLVFNYTDNAHFYYLALKTNGWELGKRDPTYPGGQRFLATGARPAATIGTANKLLVKTSGNTIRVTIDGRSVARYTDSERPYLGGSFGMYAEDSRVVFDRISTSAVTAP